MGKVQVLATPGPLKWKPSATGLGAPGTEPHSTDQKSLPTCTTHSLAKCIQAWFDKLGFDVEFCQVYEKLLGLHEESCEKYPWDMANWIQDWLQQKGCTSECLDNCEKFDVEFQQFYTDVIAPFRESCAMAKCIQSWLHQKGCKSGCLENCKKFVVVFQQFYKKLITITIDGENFEKYPWDTAKCIQAWLRLKGCKSDFLDNCEEFDVKKLIKKHEEICARYPIEFHNKEVTVEVTAKGSETMQTMTVKIEVQTTETRTETRNYHWEDSTNPKVSSPKDFTAIGCLETPQGGGHAVYIKSYNPKKKQVETINSWKSNHELDLLNDTSTLINGGTYEFYQVALIKLSDPQVTNHTPLDEKDHDVRDSGSPSVGEEKTDIKKLIEENQLLKKDNRQKDETIEQKDETIEQQKKKIEELETKPNRK